MPTAHPDQFIVARKSQRYTLFLLSVVLFFLAALYSIYISRQPDSVASVWYANAIAIMILQLLAYRDWIIVLILVAVANLTANLVLGDPVLMSLSFIPNNLLEIMLSGYLLRRFIPLSQCVKDPLLLLKAFALTVVPIAFSALLGAFVLVNYGLVSFNEGWTFLAIGSLVGNISIFPLAMLLFARSWDGIIKANQAFGFLMCILFSLAIALLSFVYLPFPHIYISASLMIVALMGGFAATAIGVLAYSLIIGTFTAIGFFHHSLQVSQQNNDIYIYMPLVITLLQPLLLGAALERNNCKHKKKLPLI